MSSLTNPGLDIEIDGQRYAFCALDFHDLEWIQMRMRAQAIEAGRMSIPEGLSEKERDDMMRPVLEHAGSISVFEKIETLFDPIGLTWLVWRMAKRKQPLLKLDTVAGWLQRPEVSGQIMPQLISLTGFRPKSPDASKQEAANSKPGKRSRSARSGVSSSRGT